MPLNTEMTQPHQSKKDNYRRIVESIPQQQQDKIRQPEKTEAEIFIEAMQDVAPLNKNGSNRIPAPRPTNSIPNNFIRSEHEAYAHLAELVSKATAFDLFYTDEYVEGAVHGLPYRMLKKLRRGELSYQDYLDLHGYTRKEAKIKVISFLERCYAKGFRCVLIIPGRGLNSTEGKPVLKEGLIKWFTHNPLKQIVLAFSSARSCDGGLGAFYVLLRRQRGKGIFSVHRYSP